MASREFARFGCALAVGAALVATRATHADSEVLGGPLAGLTPQELEAFERGLEEFTKPFRREDGVGPLFNSNSCVGCHFRHAPGGSGPSYTSNLLFARLEPGSEVLDGVKRPKIDLLPDYGGPVLRLHALAPAPPQLIPDQADLFSRRKTPRLFGLGLVEAIPEAALEAIAAENGGRIARDQEGRVLRFGSQNQASSINEFVELALAVELGIDSSEASQETVTNLTHFVRLLAPPPPTDVISEEALEGELIFHAIGCASCHVPTFTTASGAFTSNDGELVDVLALQGRRLSPYSDFLLHQLGSGVDDGIGLGRALPSEYRTAPLWGYRLRLANFLHDARAGNLHQALFYHGGDASESRAAYLRLTPDERRLLKAFLASL